MHSTHDRDSSHDANAPKTVRNIGGRQISSRKPAKRTAARVKPARLAPNVRILSVLIVLALVATGVCLHVFKVEASSAPASAANNAGAISINSSFHGLLNNTYTLTTLRPAAGITSLMLPPTVKTVCNTGTPNFTTLSAAITDLNTNFATGNVTYDVCAGFTETAPAGGYVITATGSSGNDIIIEKSGAGANPTLTGSATQTAGSKTDAVIKIVGGDFITIDGFTLQENAANVVTAVGTNTMTEIGIGIYLTTATNGAQNNTIKNNTITLSSAYQNAIGILSTSSSSSTNGSLAATSTAGTNSNNKFYSNTISSVAYGMYFICEPITATINESGIDIGGTSAATTNTITFGNATTSDIALTRFSATTEAGIYFRNGAGDSVRFNSITSNSLAYAQTSGVAGVFMVGGGTTPSGVTYTSTVSDNSTINLTNTGTTAITGIDFGAGISTGTIAGSSNTITLNQTATATNSAAVTGIKANYTSATNTCSSNTVVINQSETTGTMSGAATGITLAGTGTTLTGNSNNVTINQNSSSAGVINSTTLAINYSGAATTINSLLNTILVNQTTSVVSGNTTTVTGIQATTASTTVNVGSAGNGNSITIKQGATGAGTYGTNAVTYINVNATHATVNVVENNLLTTGSTIRTTGALIGVFQDSTVTVAVNVLNNTMNIDRVATSGSVNFQSTSTTPSEVKDTISNNNITFTNLAGSTGATAISSLGGPSSPALNNKTINGNTISISGALTGNAIGISCSFTNTGFIQNNSITTNTAAATTTGITTTGTAMTISGNTLNLSTSSTSATAMQGINVTGTGAHSITNNTFSAMNFTGIVTFSPTISGIAVSGGTGANIFGNTVTNISMGAATSSGSPAIDGILISGGTSFNVFKNKIHGITTAATGTTTIVSGIRLSAGTTNTVYNNLIGNLTTPASASTDSIRGINITSTTTTATNNIYYNTIFLNAASTGANFGTTGIFHTISTISTTATLNLRNNIIVNTSTPNGTGLTVAYRRSAGAASNLANYASTSNNNDFYAGTPGASRLIYSDGTSSAQTIAAYKNGVFTAGTIAPRDSASFSENPTFLSTVGSNANFLHIDTTVATQMESGAVNIAGITDDFDSQTRQGNAGYSGTGTAPDVGADEFAGVGVDLTAPTISYTNLIRSGVNTTRSFTNVTVTDVTGVNITAGTRPRIYYKKSTDTNTFNDNTSGTAGWKFAEANGAGGSPFTFTIDYSRLSGGAVSVGDTIQYFVVAQDTAATPNVGINSGTFTATPSSVALTAAAFPIGGTINSYSIVASLSGTKTLCASGCDYASLTNMSGVFDDINAKVIGANLIVNVTSDLTAETGTVALNQTVEEPTGNYTITIQPSGGATRNVSGSVAGALIKLNGADRITIDGLNTGGNSFAITNNSASSGAAVIWLATLGLGQGATNNTIQNATITGGSNTVTNYGVVVSGTTISANGEDNDNNTIQGNTISKVFNGILVLGTAAASSGGVDGLSISNNIIGPAASGANNIGGNGILISNAVSPSVSGNTVRNLSTSTASATPVGIALNVGVINGTVSQSTITGITASGSTATAYGLFVGSTSTGAQLTSNAVSNVTASNATSSLAVGASINGATAQVTGNTITNITASSTTGSGTVAYGIIVASTGTQVSRNSVTSIINASTSGYPARGIFVSTGVASSNVTLANNTVSDIQSYSDPSTAFSFQPVGIFLTGTTGGINLYFNSVNLFGSHPGLSSATLQAALFVDTSVTALDIRDNIFANSYDNSTSSSDKSYAIYSNAPASSFTNINYNDYYASGTAGVLGFIGGSDRTTLTGVAGWQAGTGQDAQSLSSDPMFNSTTNLQPQLGSPVLDTGVSLSGTVSPYVDFTGATRVDPPSMGAYEAGSDTVGPTITYTALGNTTSTSNRSFTNVIITDPSGVNTTAGTKPRVYYKRSGDTNTFNDNTSGTNGWKYVEANGTTSPFDFTIDYSLLNGGTGVTGGQVVQYFVVAQDLATTPNVSINSGTFTAQPTSVALTSAAFPIGGTINSYTITASIGGTKTVCASGCDYTTLTGAGGVFADINSKVVISSLEIQINGNLTAGEDGSVALNAIAEEPIGSNFAIKIYPTGTTRAITSTTAPAGGFIRLNAADRVTIDGSIGGTGTDRSLTITEANTGTTSAVVWLQSNGSDGATNNSIKNLNVVGNSNATTLIGIGSGSSTVGITSAGAGNNSNTIQNNNISKTQYGIYSGGASAGSKNTGNAITQNVINTASPNNVAIGGILVNFESGIDISQNNIAHISSGTTPAFGISLGTRPSNSFTTFTGSEVVGATVLRNIIDDIFRNGDGTSFGIGVATVTTSGSAVNTISNNAISRVRTAATPSDFAAGILLGGGTVGSTAVYFNSVSMTGSGATTAPTFGIVVGGTNPTVDLRNNIFYNTQTTTTGKTYAIGLTYSSPYTNLTSDYNDFFSSGSTANFAVTGGLTGTDRTSLAAWQAQTSKDANSKSTDPLFTSTSDLHINPATAATSPVNNAGTMITGITTDFDGETRSATTPDIGADEFVVNFSSSGNATLAGNYDSITINSPDTVTLGGNVTVSSFVLINSGGTLNMGAFTIAGAATFTLNSGGTLGIGSANGITSSGASGNVQVTGARSYSSGANYVYNGSVNQVVGNGLPASVANLTIANTGSSGNNTVTGNSGQIVTGLLDVFDGVYSSASDYVNVQIDTDGTLSLAANVTVSGNWTNNGTFISNGFGVTFDGAANQSISGSTATAFAGLTISNTGGGGGNIVTLSQNASDTALNITSGVFSQGGPSNLTSGTVTVSSGATWSNLATGDVTLSGNVSNAGTITFNANGTPCGDADDILIRSSVNGAQRTWSGTGTFSMKDVDVKDQAGTAIITVNSGTNSGNNGVNWVFVANCTGAAYTWNGGVLGDWSVGANWTPTRLVPDPGDVLTIDGSVTPGPTITNVPTQTIAALRIMNGATLTLNTTGTNTLTISGATGSDLTVPSGNGLILAGSGSALTISVASGSNGVIGGLMIFQDGTHSLIGNAAGAITFQNGAICTTASGTYNDHPFGTGAGGDGAAGSVIFASGSNYFHNSGNSPFGAAASPSVAVFQTGSTATWLTTSGFQASGRTYADLNVGKIGPSPVTVNLSDSGTGNFQFDNLQVLSDSTLTFNGSGASVVTIQGNITSDGLTANNDISLTAGSGGIILNKSGTQTFSATGGAKTITFGSNATVNSGTTLSLGRVLIMSDPGVITVSGALTRTTGYVIGYEEIVFTATGTKTHEVGTTNGYSPVETNVTALGTNPSSLRIRAVQATQPIVNAPTALKRYWQLSETGDLTTTLTFHYLDPTDIMGTEANYRIIRVVGSTAVSFPNDCANGSPCVDFANDKATIAGVSEFSDWTLGEPDAPTAVRLRSFTAKRTDGGVLLAWQSGYEVDNLGYNIYREQNGERVLVTPSLIAGSALKTGPGTELTAGMSYVWWDMSASATAAAQYWLEDVDLDGQHTMYGPFTQQAGTNVTERPPASRLLSQLTTGKNGLLPSAAQSEWPAALDEQAQGKGLPTPGLSSAQTTPLEQQFQLAGQSGVKLSVNQDGWYRVTREQLIASGLNANADLARLQLYRNGAELAMRVGIDGTIEFYGQKLDTLTTDTSVYWLIEGAAPGLRLESSPVLPANEQTASGFAMTVERRDRVIYYSSLQNGDASNIFGPLISSQAASQSLNLRHLDSATGAPAQVEVALQGVTSQGHLVSVTVNGQQVGVVSFTGREHAVWQVPVPMNALVEGENLVTLTRMNGAGDTSLVDYVRITYARTYEAENNQLACTVPAGRTVRLGGFDSAAVHVIDITNPAQPRALKVKAEPEFHGYAVTFVSAQDARLVAFTQESPMTMPFAITPNGPSGWNNQQRGANMVIITHRDFRQAVEPLAALRRQQGLSVAVVDVEDIYDEFSYSTHGPQAIKDFLAWTRTHWQRVPQYVLLVGDSSWDARNELGLAPSEFVPTKLIDTAFMETASDDWLADFDNDGVAEMAVGRLPVKTAGQTATLVSKIVAYDSAPVDPQRGAMLVADSGFEATSDGVRALLPPGMPVQTINRSSASDAIIRQQILTGINAGPRIVNYIGHGSVQVWTGAGLLQTSDAVNLTNGNRLPLFVVMTCLNGYAHDAYIDSLSEALLKAENGGAIAVWSSSGYTEPDGQVPLDRQLYQEMFNQPGIRLGDAIRLAKGATVSTDVRRTWVLLGDPSMRLR